MKRKRPLIGFWTVLTAANVLALIYPSNLLLRANSLDEHLFATVVLIISVFLLASVDAISIVVADAVVTGRR